MMPILNCDVDGVLYDFTDAMRTEINAVMGIPLEELGAPEEWRLQKAWPVTWAQVHSIMHDGIAHGRVFRKGNLIHPADSRESLQRLIDAGWHVRLVSAKTFDDSFITMQARKNMLTWIHENQIPHHTVAFSDRMGKLSYRADAIVDDKPTVEWAQWGADNFLFAQPWNIRHEGPHDQIKRVADLHEVADLLLGVPE